MPRLIMNCPECNRKITVGFFALLRLIRNAKHDECKVCHHKTYVTNGVDTNG